MLVDPKVLVVPEVAVGFLGRGIGFGWMIIGIGISEIKNILIWWWNIYLIIL